MISNRYGVACFLVVTLMTSAQAPPNRQAYGGPDVDVAACRAKIYYAIGPARLISPEGFKVTVPMKDAEAARARGFKDDYAAVIEQAKEYGNNQRSEEQAILAKLSDEQLDELYSHVFLCTSKHRDALSRDDLVYYGIAMAEIAGAKQYRAMGRLLVSSDEERVKQYNDLAAKYNNLLARCSR
jgi:hypothetical protein